MSEGSPVTRKYVRCCAGGCRLLCPDDRLTEWIAVLEAGVWMQYCPDHFKTLLAAEQWKIVEVKDSKLLQAAKAELRKHGP